MLVSSVCISNVMPVVPSGLVTGLFANAAVTSVTERANSAWPAIASISTYRLRCMTFAGLAFGNVKSRTPSPS